MFSRRFSIRLHRCKLAFALGLLLPHAKLLGEPWDVFSGGKTPENPFVRVAEKLRPAVVSISVHKAQDARALEYYWDPERGSMKRPRSSLVQFGSGLIISSDGYILTNNHVVDEASSIRVTMADNSEFNARIVGQDPETDVALIRLEMDGRLEGNPMALLGDSDALNVGEWVVAVGNPFGLQRTVSVGVVSGKGRFLEEVEGRTPLSFQDFIQTDASINPGNSGGPLANLRGEVIGINTAYRPTGSGVGFAIPINLASRVADQLRDTGRVVRGYLGVHPQAITPDLADAFGVEPGTGILVGDVKAGSPAHKGGLRRGDVIQEVGGRRVRDVASYRTIIAETRPGSEVPIRILRGGAKRTVTCAIQLRPPPTVVQKNDEPAGGPGLPVKRAWMGLVVHDRGMIEAERANDQAGEGVVVTYIAPGSASEEKGVDIGDEILEVEGVRVSTLTDYHPLSKRFERQDKPVLFLLRKKGEEVTTFVALRGKN